MPTQAQLETLKTEIDTDPLGRGYAAMTDGEVADDMNLFNRDGVTPTTAVYEYCITERADDETAVDTFILGRIQRVADSAIGDNPFNRPNQPEKALTAEQIDAAKAFLGLLTLSSQAGVVLDMTDPAFQFFDATYGAGEHVGMLDRLGGNATGGCRALKPGDITAIVALSQNILTRGQELDLGKVRKGHVTQARALP